MEAIKSYTDIEQSKKLAEILPIESADMRYQAYYDNMNNLKYIPRFVSTIIPLKADIPCWSLAALLGVLPNIHLNKYIYDGITKYYTTLIGQFNSKHYDNPVDACYDMILKSKELNLL